jgi:hypothetical protein
MLASPLGTKILLTLCSLSSNTPQFQSALAAHEDLKLTVFRSVPMALLASYSYVFR